MRRHHPANPARRLVARFTLLAGLAFAGLSLGGCIIVEPHHHGYYRY